MVSLQAALVAMALSGTSQTVMLDFYADWCKPCLAMDSTVQSLIAQGYPVQRVNIDQNRALAAKFGVQSIPCFVMVVDGREVDRVTGGTTLSRLERMCKAGAARAAPEPSPVTLAEHTTPVTRPTDSVPGSAAAPSDWRGSPPTPIQPVSLSTDVPSGTADSALLAASVRLKIEDPDGHSCGSGTIIDSRGGEALVLTCGHIFRDSQGKGNISVDLFGPNAPQRVAGRLIAYDLTRDVGLVAIRTSEPVATARLAPPNYRVAPGQQVVSIGCNNGDPPTARHSQITSLDKFLGPPNIQVAGQPVEGRSGGGLFSAEGYVIGVCNAADPDDREGLFAAPRSIHGELDRAQLSFIYETPSASPSGCSEAASPTALAADAPPPMPARMPDSSNMASANVVPASASEPSHNLPPHEQAALEEIRRSIKEGAEVVCIIRPRGDPNAKSEVIMLDRASPEFLKQLANQKRSQGGPRLTSLELPRTRKKLLEWSAEEQRQGKQPSIKR